MSDGLEALTPLATVRAAIADALGTLAGTYTFNTGDTVPAIRVEDGSNPYTDEPVVTGLEVVITRGLEIGLTPLTGSTFQQTVTTQIVLKQWDITKTTLEGFAAVWQAIADIGLNPSNPVRLIRVTKLDNIETIRFQYTESLVVSIN